MDTFIMFSVFVLGIFVPVTVYALFMKRIPKLKRKDSKAYSVNMASFQDKTHKTVDDEDVKRIRGRLTNGIAIPTFTILIDIIAVAGLVNISKDDEVTKEYVLGAVLVLLLLSSICFWRSYKVLRVFRNTTEFSKTNGRILEFKKINMAKHYGSGVISVYKVWVGFYDNKGEMLVVKDTIPEFIFLSAQKTGYCTVVLYQGRATTIIQ
jgi:hypothetical protein